MRVSSFFGCLSLRTGAASIGVIYLIFAVLFTVQDIPTFERHQWSPFYFILIMFSVIHLIGVVRKNADNVFPFLAVQYTILVLLGVRIGSQFKTQIDGERRSASGDAVLISCEIIACVVMLYFFLVLYSYYGELMSKKVTSPVSKGVKGNAALDCGDIPNNFQIQQTVVATSNEQADVQRCEESKKLNDTFH